MTRLNSKFIGLIFTLLIVSLQINCSTKGEKKNTELVFSIVDTLNYEKKDYDLMRGYFNSDSLFLSRLKKGIEQGDSNSIKINKLLTTDYESRHKFGMTDSEIDAIIFSYYASKKVLDRFKEINNELPRTDADAVQRKTDSIINSIEALKKDLKEN